MAHTLAEAREFLKDRAGEDGSTLATRIYDNLANRARAKVSDLGDMIYDRRQTRLILPGVSSDGTVSVSAGGTALTGSGTAFNTANLSAGGDVERFIRFNGEAEVYRLSAVASTTAATLAESYAQADALTDAEYEITTERIALPARFRKCNAVIETTLGGKLKLLSMDELLQARTKLRSVSEPRNFAIEVADDSNGYGVPWLNVFPAPAERRVIVLQYYQHAPIASSASDTFQLPNVPSALDAHFEIMEAMLMVHLGKAGPDAVDRALANAKRKLATFRATDGDSMAQEWTPEGDNEGGLQTFERITVPGY